LEVDVDSSAFSFLKDIGRPAVSSWVVLPIYSRARLIALVCLGIAHRAGYTTTDLEQARQLAHQLAVALSNAELMRELKTLNMGTLNALARTVDAKSPWTAGHSERVMQLSLQIAKTMGFSADQVTDMHRAALLHDIGKIAIPASILDKKEPLTDEEFAQIRTHPSIGARILDPLAAFQRLIPVVEQHHERFDGKGYPKGLAGEEIHPAARIMAVADSFDAMVSDRPYRKGMPLTKVRSIIQQESGRQFDPKVVSAFERVVARKFPLAMVGENNYFGTTPPSCEGRSKAGETRHDRK
jgi:putative nucleotidyltransferase with HDIG domain